MRSGIIKSPIMKSIIIKHDIMKSSITKSSKFELQMAPIIGNVFWKHYINSDVYSDVYKVIIEHTWRFPSIELWCDDSYPEAPLATP